MCVVVDFFLFVCFRRESERVKESESSSLSPFLPLPLSLCVFECVRVQYLRWSDQIESNLSVILWYFTPLNTHKFGNIIAAGAAVVVVVADAAAVAAGVQLLFFFCEFWQFLLWSCNSYALYFHSIGDSLLFSPKYIFSLNI